MPFRRRLVFFRGGNKTSLWAAFAQQNRSKMRRRRTLREVHTREAQLQQRSVVRVANSTAYVIHVNERSVFISASARGMLDYLQCAGDDPALSGMPVSYGAQLFKLHGYRAVVKLVSFPDDGYFTRLSRAALEEPWRKLPNVVVVS